MERDKLNEFIGNEFKQLTWKFDEKLEGVGIIPFDRESLEIRIP